MYYRKYKITIICAIQNMNYKEILTIWKEFKIPSLFSRSHSFELETDFITAISGPRRAGKTFICFQMIEELMKKGISKENDLDKLLEVYKEIYTLNKNQHIYLFFDEIQTVKNWDAWVRKINDIDKNIKLILTGSSSKLLSREISTTLRGRVLNREIFPLSFKEIKNRNKE